MTESEMGPEPGSTGGSTLEGGPSYARSSVRQQADRVKQRAREAGRDATEAGRQKAEELKERAERATDELTSRMGGRAASVARALRRAGEELRGDGEEQLAQMSEQAAGQVERIGSYLDGQKPSGMMADLEAMARTNPAFFVGGTFAMGLLMGRFLRSGEPEPEAAAEAP